MQYNPYMAMRPPMPMPYPPPMMPPMALPPGAFPVGAPMVQGPAIAPAPGVPLQSVPVLTPGDTAAPVTITPAPTVVTPAPITEPLATRRQPLPAGPSSPIFTQDAAPGCGCGSLPDPAGCCVAAPACTDCLDKHAHDHACTWWIEADGEANFLRPYFSSNRAFIIASLSTGLPTTAVAGGDDFSWKWTVSPSMHVELVSCSGIGIRAQYFRFDESSQTADTTLPTTATIVSAFPSNSGLGLNVFGTGVPGAVVTATSNLKLETIDVLGTYNFEAPHWKFALLAGGRYLDFRQNYSFVGAPPAGVVADTVVDNYHQSFSGAGPMIGFEFHRYFGCTGLNAYGKVDGALLVGNAIETFSGSFVDLAGTPTQLSNASVRHSPLISTVDLELGAQYTFGGCKKVQPFIRAAVVDQTYFDAGNASSRTGNMSLFGGKVTGGIGF
jgi:hypothetical protein